MLLVVVCGGPTVGSALLRGDRVVGRQKTAACQGVSGYSVMALGPIALLTQKGIRAVGVQGSIKGTIPNRNGTQIAGNRIRSLGEREKLGAHHRPRQ